MKIFLFIFLLYLNLTECTGSTATVTYQSKFGFSGNGDGQLSSPKGITLGASRNIYVADTGNNRIQVFSSSGAYQSQFGSNGAGNGQFSSPSGIALDSSNKIYVADTGNNRVEIFDNSGAYQSQFGSNGAGNGNFTFPVQHVPTYPTGIALDSSNNIYVADTGNNRVEIFDNSAAYQSKFGSFGTRNGQLISPSGIALDSSRNIYVADTSNNRIQIFNNSGVYQSQINISGGTPTAIALDSSNNLYVVNSGNCIQVFNSSGVYQTQFGTTGSGDGEFLGPNGIAIDSSGYIYIADSGNNRIQIFKIAWITPSSSSSQQQVTKILESSTGLPTSQAQSLVAALFDGSARSSILNTLSSSQTSSVAISAVQSVKTGSDVTTNTTSSAHQVASAAMDVNSSSQDLSSQKFTAFQGFTSARLQQFKNLGDQLPFLKFQSVHSIVRPITPISINNISPLVATPFENPPPTFESIFLPKGNSHVWVQPFGGIQRMSSYNGITGMTSKNSGTAIGAGYNLTQNLTLGVLMGGTVNSYTLDQNQGNGTANNYYAGLYGGYAGQEGISIKGSLIFGQDRYTAQRNITALSLSAKNTHRGWNVSGRSEIGYQFRYGVNTFTPFVGVGLSKSYQNGYQETNAYPFNLNIPPTSNKTLSTEVGIKFQKSIVINDALLKPLIGFSIIRDQPLQKENSSVLSFADSSNTFAVPASNKIKTYAAATAGIASVLSDNVTISTLVTGKIKHHEHAVEAVVKFTYAF